MALDGNIKEHMKKNKEYGVKYLRFVKSIRLNREALLLDKFKLHWFEGIDNYQYYTPKSVTELIPHALKFKPRVLSVEFLLNNCENLDVDSIFTCDSLEDVHLSCNYDLKKFAPNSINLPHLKKLELLRLAIGSDFLINVSLGCPVLEELTLRHCRLYFDRIDFNILKKLIIVDCFAWKKADKLKICTPSLLHLDIKKCFGLRNVSARNMPSLVDATIEFGWYENDVVIGREPNFLGSLSNVTSLHVIVECEIKLWENWENASPNSGLEEPKDDLSPREHLEMVTIVKCCMRKISSETVDLLVKYFYAHVRTIGKILIPN
ncbi:F-box protein [Carex littledalei]|uniref:F-box protein n=1 Tax=Carex littledalei TaxID=544730 RepID=A0A833VLX6_9POAL|nr:F-box protein [Carex littledalei]